MGQLLQVRAWKTRNHDVHRFLNQINLEEKQYYITCRFLKVYFYKKPRNKRYGQVRQTQGGQVFNNPHVWELCHGYVKPLNLNCDVDKHTGHNNSVNKHGSDERLINVRPTYCKTILSQHSSAQQSTKPRSGRPALPSINKQSPFHQCTQIMT